jgi:hypothetical protein
VIALLLALATAQVSPTDPSIVHGMTLSTPTYNGEWGSDALPGTFEVLASEGINWVSYHPYARIRRDGSVTMEFDPDHPPEWLTRPIRDAHARGLKVMVKPHLAHWGSGFSWRGDIAFDTPEAEARFFREYTAWITAVARITCAADAFVVGTELDATTHNIAAWREVIANVRTVFPGALTFASNWDKFGNIAFWDDLDAVGIQAYFPVLRDSEGVTVANIEAGWTRILTDVHAVSARTGKPVIFTELGYDAHSDALLRPWEGGRGDNATQAMALSTTLRILDADPIVRGAFLWKWFPGEVQRGDFRMSHPEVRAILREQWGSGE